MSIAILPRSHTKPVTAAATSSYNKFFKLPTALDVVLVNVPLPREPTCTHHTNMEVWIYGSL